MLDEPTHPRAVEHTLDVVAGRGGHDRDPEPRLGRGPHRRDGVVVHLEPDVRERTEPRPEVRSEGVEVTEVTPLPEVGPVRRERTPDERGEVLVRPGDAPRGERLGPRDHGEGLGVGDRPVAVERDRVRRVPPERRTRHDGAHAGSPSP